MKSSWLFQANPKFSQILEAIQKRYGIYGLVTCYNKEIAPGDGVLIWIAEQKAAIYEIAEVSEAPQSQTIAVIKLRGPLTDDEHNSNVQLH
jgi:hypothetical protein